MADFTPITYIILAIVGANSILFQIKKDHIRSILVELFTNMPSAQKDIYATRMYSNKYLQFLGRNGRLDEDYRNVASFSYITVFWVVLVYVSVYFESVPNFSIFPALFTFFALVSLFKCLWCSKKVLELITSLEVQPITKAIDDLVSKELTRILLEAYHEDRKENTNDH